MGSRVSAKSAISCCAAISGLAFGILTILVVLILPLPSIVLDLFLAISITLSILILMTSLFIQRRWNSPRFRPSF